MGLSMTVNSFQFAVTPTVIAALRWSAGGALSGFVLCVRRLGVGRKLCKTSL
jgi:hypothetical protein